MPNTEKTDTKPSLRNARNDVEVRRKYRKWQYAMNRDKAIADAVRWNAENPEKRKSAYTKHNRARYWKDPLKFKSLRLKRDYGIGIEEFNRMTEAQSGVCAICKVSRGGVRGLNVDHDHATGRVRDLLCTPCNTNLGYFEKFREAMLAYLDKHKC